MTKYEDAVQCHTVYLKKSGKKFKIRQQKCDIIVDNVLNLRHIDNIY